MLFAVRFTHGVTASRDLARSGSVMIVCLAWKCNGNRSPNFLNTGTEGQVTTSSRDVVNSATCCEPHKVHSTTGAQPVSVALGFVVVRVGLKAAPRCRWQRPQLGGPDPRVSA